MYTHQDLRNAEGRCQSPNNSPVGYGSIVPQADEHGGMPSTRRQSGKSVCKQTVANIFYDGLLKQQGLLVQLQNVGNPIVMGLVDNKSLDFKHFVDLHQFMFKEIQQREILIFAQNQLYNQIVATGHDS